MSANVRVEFFSSMIADPEVGLQTEINNWLEAEKLGPADIIRICQSESVDPLNDPPTSVTLSIWYIPRQ